MSNENKEKKNLPVMNLDPITSIKVDVKVLDSLMTLTEELLVEKMRMEQVIKTMDEAENAVPVDLEATTKNISRLTSDLQYIVAKTHMVPLSQLFERFPRMVRDLAKSKGKEVTYESSGQDIELDRAVIDRLGEPLIHLLRNAVDHGIEDRGKISIHAKRSRDSVEIVVENEGEPINWNEVLESAARKGIISETKAKNLRFKESPEIINQNSEIINLLYHPQLSTKKKVTQTSGRGVGLAIVKSTIESIGGKVMLQTGKGGTRFNLSLPLTIAIVQALLVRVSGNVFALPFSQVDRLVRVPFTDIKKAFDQEVAVVGTEDIPLVRLGSIFDLEEGKQGIFISEKEMESFRFKSNAELLVVTKREEFSDGSTTGQVGLVVDEVFSEQDIVVKPLRGVLKQSKGFAGVTLLGDGKPALILDVATLI